MQDDDLNRNLIGQGRKGSQQYIKRVQQIQQQIQTLRNKNNLLQKQSDNDIDDTDIKRQVYHQSQFIQKEINKLKQLLQKFAKQFKDPSAKNKLKQLWKMASKQIQRNKVIMQRIVNQAPRESFMSRDDRLRSSAIQNRQSSKGANINNRVTRRQSGYSNNFNTRQGNNNNSNFNTRQSISQQQIVMDDSQLALQNKLTKQKNEILSHLQQKNQKINQVMNQIALLVDQQGQHVNMITQNVDQVGGNLLQANQDLDGAIVEQKKARRKYCCLAMVGLLVALLIVGVVFIITNGDQQKDDKTN